LQRTEEYKVRHCGHDRHFKALQKTGEHKVRPYIVPRRLSDMTFSTSVKNRSSIRFISSITNCPFQVFLILDEGGFEPFLKKEKRFILVSLKDIFSIDTAIHPMMECTFISQSYSSHNVFYYKRVKK